MINLKQAIKLMKELKERDYNDEYNVFFSNGKPVIESKAIIIKEVYNGISRN